MKHKKKMYSVATIAFLSVLMVLFSIPLSSAAGAITLTPPMQDPGASVTVDGTGFGAEKTVGIGLGAEVTVESEMHEITDLVTDPVYDEELDVDTYGPFGATANHYPLVPGSVYVFYDVSGSTSEYFDFDPPNGTLNTESLYAVDPYVNYVNGTVGRRSSVDWASFTDVFVYLTYRYYAHNVTPAAGVNTSPDGAFSASITIPTDINGDLTLTAVDSAGNIASSNLTVVPEGLTIGVMLVLSTIAVVVSARYFRKHPKTKSYNSIKI